MTAAEAASLTAEQLVAWALETHGRRFAIVTAFQPEGMVLVDMALRHDPRARIVTVDTGRLPEATHAMIDTVRAHYGAPVEAVFPDAAEVQRMTTRHGMNLFHADPSLRKLCCQIRKVRPLEAALIGSVEAWASGLRREQSEERADTAKWEESPGKPLKLNPLADWTREQVTAYTRRHGVPRHPLLEQGYATVGCAPCSRAILPGDGERSGRWWWEIDGSKECGIHVTPEGRMKRTLDVLLGEILH